MKTDALKGILRQLDAIKIIESPFLPAQTMIVSQDVAEMLRQLPTKEDPE